VIIRRLQAPRHRRPLRCPPRAGPTRSPYLHGERERQAWTSTARVTMHEAPGSPGAGAGSTGEKTDAQRHRERGGIGRGRGVLTGSSHTLLGVLSSAACLFCSTRCRTDSRFSPRSIPVTTTEGVACSCSAVEPNNRSASPSTSSPHMSSCVRAPPTPRHQPSRARDRRSRVLWECWELDSCCGSAARAM